MINRWVKSQMLTNLPVASDIAAQEIMRVLLENILLPRIPISLLGSLGNEENSQY